MRAPARARGRACQKLPRKLTSEGKQLRSARVRVAVEHAEVPSDPVGSATFGITAATAVRKRFVVMGTPAKPQVRGPQQNNMPKKGKHFLK